MKKVIIAPSILSGNFADMGGDVGPLEALGADWVHIDVMDGVFVPNLTFGFKMISDIRPLSRLPFDVHLMITNPKRFVDRFIKSGADLVSFHYEAESDIDGTLDIIKNAGCKAGLAVKPDTPVDVIAPYLEKLDLIVIMSVYPGFGGQKFIKGSAERIAEASALRNKYNPHALIEVDGGITVTNSGEALRAGADVLVTGSAVFGAADRKQAIRVLRGE